MEWDDDGVVLAVRRHGETGAVASLLTRSHGRHAGLVHGGQGRANRPILQPGNLVRARWTGRLPEQLGNFRLEMLHAHAAAFLDDAARLAALGSACALAEAAWPSVSLIPPATPPWWRCSTPWRRNPGPASMCISNWPCCGTWGSASTSRPAPPPAGPMIWPGSAPRPAVPSPAKRESPTATSCSGCRPSWWGAGKGTSAPSVRGWT
ncbi:Recombinational DNA repair protein [Paramagnetospirillum magneticum AMB-1]|uniref:Recombinational DNA repair protein n=1 Tax=Paramagnetospirillum magneticum (strain ATCC 700264 / AMB-1) TaxID=342108 RepID=Q2W510_PARM1|nr:Recombinational DNA repair protein [Paramagnetospirillum magneticum AMB-1]